MMRAALSAARPVSHGAYPADFLRDLLTGARTIAVVGASNEPWRPSFGIMRYLQRAGYRVVPVNPALAVWEGIRAVPDLDHVAEVLGPGEQVDIVDVFRQSSHVAGIVDDCIRLGLPALWLQLGVVDETAAQRAVDAGIQVVMDKCIKIERSRLR